MTEQSTHPTTSGHPQHASRLTTLGFAGVAGFAFLVAALHVLEPDFEPASRFISEYATADTGLLMKAAFFSLATAIGAVAVALRRSLAPGKRVRPSVACLLVTAAGVFLSGIFDSDVLVDGEVEDVTVSGVLHDLSGFVSFFTAITAMFMLRGVFARDPRWSRRARPQLIFAVGQLALFVAMIASPTQVVGATQRLHVTLVLAWLVTVNWWIREAGRSPVRVQTAAPR